MILVYTDAELIVALRSGRFGASDAADVIENLFVNRDALWRCVQAADRIRASDAAHETIHAPDGDDVARMMEFAASREEYDAARAALREKQP